MTDTNTKTPKITLKGAKAALEEILAKAGADFAEISGDEAVDLLSDIQAIADDALNPKSGPSALTVTTNEVAGFIMRNFRLAFASNDDIAEALNAAGILSPTGKTWSRSNISKIMPGVREVLVQMHSGSGDAPQAPVTPAQEAPEPVSQPEVAETPEGAPEPVSEPVQTTVAPAHVASTDEEDLMAELDGLDDIDDLTLAKT